MKVQIVWYQKHAGLDDVRVNLQYEGPLGWVAMDLQPPLSDSALCLAAAKRRKASGNDWNEGDLCAAVAERLKQDAADVTMVPDPETAEDAGA